MSLWLLIVVVPAAIAYLALIGVIWIRVYRNRQNACLDCNTDSPCIDTFPHIAAATIVALAWPALVWIMLPAIYADPHRQQIRITRMNKRIAELEREAGIR